ncbi:hypothetical protein [Streptomyces sp. NPDC058108]|uniref:hypothetical protein n=1 Tax=Streptomyces sp. NPDC058108 TaxID=3346344 RepID=UPI0036E17DC6
MAVCVADGEMASRVATDLELKHGITTATLTKDAHGAALADRWGTQPRPPRAGSSVQATAG